MVKLTATQRKILNNLALGNSWWLGMPSGMSAAGGWDSSYRSCFRRGWIARLGIYDVITEAGRAALEAKEG